MQGQLEHPALVPVYDLGIDENGGLFFSMKRVRGQTLQEVLGQLIQKDTPTERRYSRRKLLTAFLQVCQAVDFAHARGVVHRDLKPGNIMLGDFGEVHLLDWGLAKVGAKAPVQTSHGSVLGTPGYMSPEQARGETDLIDARSDVYALGAVLFEILTLQKLHPEKASKERLQATLRGADARARLRVPERDVPLELERLCVEATRFERDSRLGSARAICEGIERFLDGDRDLESRRKLADEHARAARSALTTSPQSGTSAQSARTTALREAFKALALDPEHPTALSTVGELLLSPGGEVPRAVQSRMEQAIGKGREKAARLGLYAYASWFLFLPALMVMGIRSWPVAAAAMSAAVMSMLMCLWIARRGLALVPVLLLMTFSTLAISSFSSLFGPFVLVPSVALAHSMFLVLHAGKGWLRRVLLLLSLVPVLLPFLLERTGVLPASVVFTGGQVVLMPRLTDFPPDATLLVLLITTLAITVAPSLYLLPMRDQLTAAEERLQLQAWHLEQLMPERLAVTPAPSAPLAP